MIAQQGKCTRKEKSFARSLCGLQETLSAVIIKRVYAKAFFDTISNFEFFYEAFEIRKVVKLDKFNYAFEAYKLNSFDRMLSGKIEIRQISDVYFKVVKFEMREFGTVYNGTMNRYVQLSSEIGNFIVNKFITIDFGNFNAAMGDDSIKY